MADPVLLGAWGFEQPWLELVREGWSFTSGINVTVETTTSFANSSGGYGGVRCLRMRNLGASADAYVLSPPISGTPYSIDVSTYQDHPSEPLQDMVVSCMLGSNIQFSLKFGGDNHLTVFRGATLIATVNDVFTPVEASRHRIQVKCLAQTTGGYAEVLIDGISVYTLSGNTQGLGSPGWDRVQLGCEQADGDYYYFDDLIVTDNSNGGLYVAEQRLARLNPASETFSDFTGSSGSAANLSDDSDVTYNEGLAIGESQRFAIEDLPFTPVRITGIVLRPTFERDGVVNALIPFVHISGVDYSTAAITGIGVGSFVSGSRILQTSPATTIEWDPAEFAAMEAGYELDG